MENTARNANLVSRVFRFYADGFRSMTTGRRLWALIIIKLAIIFLVFRLFFFHDYLGERYSTDDERARAVAGELINRTSPSDSQ